jgi:hypothetical protein
VTSPFGRPGLDPSLAIREGRRLLRRARLVAWAATVATAAIVVATGFGVRTAVTPDDEPEPEQVESSTTSTATVPTAGVAPTEFGQFAQGLAFQSFIFSHDGDVGTLDVTADADPWNEAMFRLEPDEFGDRGFRIAIRCDAYVSLAPPRRFAESSRDELLDVIRGLGCEETYAFVGTDYAFDGQDHDYTFAVEDGRYHLAGTFRINIYGQMHQGWNGVTLNALPIQTATS